MILSKALNVLDNILLDNVIFSRQNRNLDILILVHVHVSLAGVVGLERAFLYVENGEVHIKILKLTLKKTPVCTSSFCVLQITCVVVVNDDDDDDDDGDDDDDDDVAR